MSRCRVRALALVLMAVAVPAGAQSTRAQLPEGHEFTNPDRAPFSLSADGARLVYVARAQVFVSELDGGAPAPVRGPVEARGKSNPILSPDGQFIVYWAQDDSVLERVPVEGGTPVRLVAVANPSGMSWTAGGELLVGQGADGILRVSGDGTSAERIVTVEPGELAIVPQLLPDGETVLFSLGQGSPTTWTVVAQSLRTDARTTVVPGSNARYLPAGVLVYVTDGNVVADRFDAASLSLSGEPVVVARDVPTGADTGVAQLALAPTGAMVVARDETPPVRMSLVALDGTRTVLGEVLADASGPRLSLDGRQVAFAAATPGSRGRDVWIADLSDVSTPRRVIEDANFPVFSPDGEWLAFGSLGQARENGEEALFMQRADGSGEATLIAKPARAPEDWRAGDQGFTFITHRGVANNYDVWVYNPDRKEVEPLSVIPETAQLSGAFSPDLRWVAYMSNESGDWQIWVQPYPLTGEKHQVTSGGGRSPRWLPDGRLVFEQDANIATVTVGPGAAPTFSEPEQHPITGFIQPLLRRSWDVTPDGRLLMLFRTGPSLDVVTDLSARLDALATR